KTAHRRRAGDVSRAYAFLLILECIGHQDRTPEACWDVSQAYAFLLILECIGHQDRTPEACWDFSQAYAFFAYAWSASDSKTAPRQGCRGDSSPSTGCAR